MFHKECDRLGTNPSHRYGAGLFPRTMIAVDSSLCCLTKLVGIKFLTPRALGRVARELFGSTERFRFITHGVVPRFDEPIPLRTQARGH